MGISNLLKALKDKIDHVHLRKLAGKTAAIDTLCWLHKGVYACCTELCTGVPTNAHIQYCLDRIALLLRNNIRPLMVFDGGYLPSKGGKEDERASSRKRNMEKGRAYLRVGNRAAAHACFTKAVDVTPQMAYNLIKVLQYYGIDYVVAPYEADAQLAFMVMNGYADFVISEDSDTIPYGCRQVLFKLDREGYGDLATWKHVLSSDGALDLTGWTRHQFLHMCILSGCDYVPSIAGMGIKSAYRVARSGRTVDKLFDTLCRLHHVPPGYQEEFERARLTFLHQRVYDPAKKCLVHLTPLAPGTSSDGMDFLGPDMPADLAQAIATAAVDPSTLRPYEPVQLTRLLKSHLGTYTTQIRSLPRASALHLGLVDGPSSAKDAAAGGGAGGGAGAGAGTSHDDDGDAGNDAAAAAAAAALAARPILLEQKSITRFFQKRPPGARHRLRRSTSTSSSASSSTASSRRSQHSSSASLLSPTESLPSASTASTSATGVSHRVMATALRRFARSASPATPCTAQTPTPTASLRRPASAHSLAGRASVSGLSKRSASSGGRRPPGDASATKASNRRGRLLRRSATTVPTTLGASPYFKAVAPTGGAQGERSPIKVTPSPHMQQQQQQQVLQTPCGDEGEEDSHSLVQPRPHRLQKFAFHGSEGGGARVSGLKRRRPMAVSEAVPDELRSRARAAAPHVSRLGRADSGAFQSPIPGSGGSATTSSRRLDLDRFRKQGGGAAKTKSRQKAQVKQAHKPTPTPTPTPQQRKRRRQHVHRVTDVASRPPSSSRLPRHSPVAMPVSLLPPAASPASASVGAAVSAHTAEEQPSSSSSTGRLQQLASVFGRAAARGSSGSAGSASTSFYDGMASRVQMNPFLQRFRYAQAATAVVTVATVKQ